MIVLTDEVSDFLNKQGFVIVSTLNRDGCIHNSCKGIVKIDKTGKLFLLDLYQKQTLANLKEKDCISVTAVDEHRFMGYCLKGRGKVVCRDELTPEIIQLWDDKIISRVAQRVLKNIQGQSGHPRHPEAGFPKPEYMILMEVEEVIDLTPPHLKQGGTNGK